MFRKRIVNWWSRALISQMRLEKEKGTQAAEPKREKTKAQANIKFKKLRAEKNAEKQAQTDCQTQVETEDGNKMLENLILRSNKFRKQKLFHLDAPPR